MAAEKTIEEQKKLALLAGEFILKGSYENQHNDPYLRLFFGDGDVKIPLDGEDYAKLLADELKRNRS